MAARDEKPDLPYHRRHRGGWQGNGLAKEGFTIVVAARNANKAEALKTEIETLTGNASCDYIVADLGSLRQVRQLAETFRRRHSTLDVLINNTGVFLPTRTVTEDGCEMMFQVNYLSPCSLPIFCSMSCRRASKVGSST